MQTAESARGIPVRQVPLGRERKFMRVREVARVLDVSGMTIRRAFASGVVPGITFGTSSRILTAFVRSLVAEAEAGRQVKVEDFGREWQASHAAQAARAAA